MNRLSITPRQQQVLRLVGDGLTNRQIARELGFSEGTVRNDLTQMTRLLGVNGRCNLYVLATSGGLLGTADEEAEPPA